MCMLIKCNLFIVLSSLVRLRAKGLEKETVNHLCCYNETIDNKSQVESNGTVLSIDWKDVGAKKIESTLHDDLALKTWKI
ncbi:hypothetical protein IGI04_012940 [Brassica rapa subsp. trilocularis]|uniref:SGS domain-containing protein n=1 Tax=Brassica rapa subsp. trilocularis TaxID=1813537 RepID=A0ABQ7N9H8_BRACM|nr:hypothetical protein IGI04_012940 [Brassica rapa subsp. trilocularis]